MEESAVLQVDEQARAREEVCAKHWLVDGGAHETLQAVRPPFEHHWQGNEPPSGDPAAISGHQERQRRSAHAVRVHGNLRARIDQVARAGGRVHGVK